MRKTPVNFRHVLTYFYGTPWAILPAKLAEIKAVLWRRIESPDLFNMNISPGGDSRPGGARGDLPPSSSPPGVLAETPAPADEVRDGNGYQVIGTVGLIKIGGTINPRPSLFDEWSGGTSHESVGKATDNAVADTRVETIVYDIDSPGGVIFGMPENAEKVLGAKKSKPTIAVAHHLAASAAYWYMAQAAELVATPAAMVGSIGVLMNAIDETEALKLAGIRDVLVSNKDSPHKAEGYPQIPFTEDQRADMQRQTDIYGEMFFDAVAKGRGIRATTVKNTYGKGRVLIASEALDAGMIDRIDTLQGVIDRANKKIGKATRRNVAASLAAKGLPTAARPSQ